MTARRWKAAPTWPKPVPMLDVLAPDGMTAPELARRIHVAFGLRVLLKPATKRTPTTTDTTPPTAA